MCRRLYADVAVAIKIPNRHGPGSVAGSVGGSHDKAEEPTIFEYLDARPKSAHSAATGCSNVPEQHSRFSVFWADPRHGGKTGKQWATRAKGNSPIVWRRRSLVKRGAKT